MIRFRCPRCNTPDEAPDTDAGLETDCEHCHTRFYVPGDPVPVWPRVAFVLTLVVLFMRGSVWISCISWCIAHYDKIKKAIAAPAATSAHEAAGGLVGAMGLIFAYIIARGADMILARIQDGLNLRMK